MPTCHITSIGGARVYQNPSIILNKIKLEEIIIHVGINYIAS
jgi:hypothetical protein